MVILLVPLWDNHGGTSGIVDNWLGGASSLTTQTPNTPPTAAPTSTLLRLVSIRWKTALPEREKFDNAQHAREHCTGQNSQKLDGQALLTT